VPDFQIVAALVRRDDDLLMVRQAGPGEEPAWTVPGGRVESGELLTEALGRELLEETGIRVVEPGHVAFMAHWDDRQDGWSASVWTCEVAA
jgi:8-oxo-dGTP diphosphatase